MREIKFRAWNVTLQRMSKSKNMQELIETAIHEEAKGLKVSENYSNLIFMQFTGLKDKSGKEVYEGDVVREDSPPHHCGEIKYDGGAFYISYITDGYSELCHILVDEFWEIIGNIYENPELLEEK